MHYGGLWAMAIHIGILLATTPDPQKIRKAPIWMAPRGVGGGLWVRARAKGQGQGPGPRARVACAQTRTRMNVHKHLQTSHTFILVHKHACTRMNVHKHFQTFLIQTHTCLGRGPRARAKGQGQGPGPRARGSLGGGGRRHPKWGLSNHLGGGSEKNANMNSHAP